MLSMKLCIYTGQYNLCEICEHYFFMDEEMKLCYQVVRNVSNLINTLKENIHTPNFLHKELF